jgi:glycosyltransferase involved in cell wall biosynthesis
LLGDKGIREYVAAARLIRSERQDAHFQLLGGFDPHNRTSVRPRELDGWVAEGVIEYLGETEDVRPFIASASAVVLPSYREGLPRTLLEGAAMARPLIATDVPGCRCVVEDGVNGLLCRARNAQSLAEAMSRFLKLDWSERRQMGSAGREMVEIRFCQDLVERAYLEAIASM